MENENITPVVEKPAVPQVSQIPPVPEKKNNLFQIAVIVVGILIVLGLFVNAYLMFSKKETATKTSDSSIAVTPTLTLDPTANWKTYTNVNIGFEIKYPPSLALIEVSPKSLILKDGQASPIINITETGNVQFDDGSIGITAFQSKRVNQTLTDWIKYGDSGKPPIPGGNYLPTVINGKEAVILETIDEISEKGKLMDKYVLIKNGKTILWFQTSKVVNSTEWIKTFDQILSTFKFLD